MANSTKIQLLDTIQGSSFLAIQSTMDIFQRHNPELAHSKIEVIHEGNSEVVILTSKADSTNTQKNFGVRLESKEELSTQDLSTLRSDMEQTQLMDQIQGSHFPLIKKATEVFRRHNNPDLMRYNIKVVRDGDSVVVIFADKDRPTGTRGSVGKPGFEVELNPQDMSVIKANFVR